VIAEERARGRTVVTTTHDIGAAAAADLVVLLASEVIAFGPPAEVLTPDLLSRAFGGHLHVLPDGTLVLDDPSHHGLQGGLSVTALDHTTDHDHGGHGHVSVTD
jgi:ABC-type cobalamin/Fe3+-siderophores transport system ATPase subunit